MRDPGGHFHLAVDTNRKFQRCFFCPTAMQTLWRESRRFLAINSTFLTGRFIQTLLLAVGIDANSEATIIAWGVVEGENAASWTYFVDHLKLALPGFASEPAIIISDRDKGLESGLGLQNTQVKHVHCCYHLLQNMIKGRGGRSLEKPFWKVARAKTPEKYKYYLGKLRAISPSAADYLLTIDREKYVLAFAPDRFGHDTSNVVEAVNKVLKPDRDRSILSLLDGIWSRAMCHQFGRWCNAIKADQRNEIFTPYCRSLVDTSRQYAGGYTVQLASESEAKVISSEGWIYLVKLDETSATCSCRRPVICGHSLAVIFKRGHHLERYLPEALTVDQWKTQYSGRLRPMILSELKSNVPYYCSAPVTRQPRGRPRKERIRTDTVRRRGKGLGLSEMTEDLQIAVAETRQRQQRHCGTCGRTGHDSRRCRSGHA